MISVDKVFGGFGYPVSVAEYMTEMDFVLQIILPRIALPSIWKSCGSRGHFRVQWIRYCRFWKDVGAQIGRKPEITERDIRLHMRKRLPLPLIAWRGLNDEDMARWAECGADVEGIDLVVETTRVYPEGAFSGPFAWLRGAICSREYD